MQKIKMPVFYLTLLAVLSAGGPALAAWAEEADEVSNQVFDPKHFSGMEYRSLGFSRGGRSTAVAGVVGHPRTFYFGASGGGVWKTENGGISWSNVTDDDFEVGSIGSIAVAASDPNVIYVGTGSTCPRGNVSPGNGIYKSTDAGRSWKHIGLPEAGQIGRIRVHPDNPDLVYAAVLGHIFGPNEERGVYRSKDGGESWEKVLYASEQTGAIDIAMDATNPRILYAAMWRAERKPWTLFSGSEDGGIYKSTDSGDNWEKLSGGLPSGLVGKIGLAVSPADPDRIWAIIEADKGKGGIYRSENAGESWRRINDEARFIQRPWYYNHIYADPQSANTVYVLNTGMYRSNDGGSNWDRVGTPHGDNHDLWINPDHPDFMIEGNDGGANVSFDGGQSWSQQMNQPTAEIYRVIVDDQFPHRVYGAQQDNSTISIPSRRGGGRSVMPDWYSVGGCESGHIAVDPRNHNIAYAGCYGGNISRIDRGTGESRAILVYPQLQLGQAPRDLKYRFQWNAPIRLSPHDPSILYHTSQMVHRSRDEGQSWEAISGDLTRNDKSKQDYAGGPISHDSTGVEVYGVIFAFEDSPHQKGLLWAGSDDGRVHISRNDGKKWDEITPPGLPEWATVNMIDLSAHHAGRAHIAVQRYRMDDFTPYIFRTDDYGKTWQRLTDGSNGIPADHFVRVVREDPDRKGLLYAGTEFGIYVSFDDGAHWQSLQLNLPATPVTDLAFKRKNLIVSTQGRAFWQLDDLTPLQQLSGEVAQSGNHLYEPRDAYRANTGGARISYYLAEEPEGEVKIEILDKDGEVINTYKGKAGEEERGGPPQARFFRGGGGRSRVNVKAGLNRFSWNLRYPGVEVPRGVVLWGRPGGLTAVPGQYQVRLTIGEWTQTRSFNLLKDPRIDATQADFEEQFEFVQKVGGEIERLYAGLSRLRDIRQQVDRLNGRIKDIDKSSEEMKEATKTLKDKLKGVEEQLTQTKSKSNQDPLNFPPQLDNQFTTLYNYAAGPDARPTSGAQERLDDLKAQLNPLLEELDQILGKELKAYSAQVDKLDLDPIILSSNDK